MSAKTAVDPEAVARAFLKEYYSVMRSHPEHLHRYYKDNSSFLYRDLDSETAVGQSEIHKKIMKLKFKNSQAIIRKIDSLETLDGAILAQVTGFFSNNHEPLRSFSQTLVLGKVAPNHFYIHNNIFFYTGIDFDISDEEMTASETEDPGKTFKKADEQGFTSVTSPVAETATTPGARAELVSTSVSDPFTTPAAPTTASNSYTTPAAGPSAASTTGPAVAPDTISRVSTTASISLLTPLSRSHRPTQKTELPCQTDSLPESAPVALQTALPHTSSGPHASADPGTDRMAKPPAILDFNPVVKSNLGISSFHLPPARGRGNRRYHSHVNVTPSTAAVQTTAPVKGKAASSDHIPHALSKAPTSTSSGTQAQKVINKSISGVNTVAGHPANLGTSGVHLSPASTKNSRMVHSRVSVTRSTVAAQNTALVKSKAARSDHIPDALSKTPTSTSSGPQAQKGINNTISGVNTVAGNPTNHGTSGIYLPSSRRRRNRMLRSRVSVTGSTVAAHATAPVKGKAASSDHTPDAFSKAPTFTSSGTQAKKVISNTISGVNTVAGHPANLGTSEVHLTPAGTKGTPMVHSHVSVTRSTVAAQPTAPVKGKAASSDHIPDTLSRIPTSTSSGTQAQKVINNTISGVNAVAGHSANLGTSGVDLPPASSKNTGMVHSRVSVTHKTVATQTTAPVKDIFSMVFTRTPTSPKTRKSIKDIGIQVDATDYWVISSTRGLLLDVAKGEQTAGLLEEKATKPEIHLKKETKQITYADLLKGNQPHASAPVKCSADETSIQQSSSKVIHTAAAAQQFDGQSETGQIYQDEALATACALANATVEELKRRPKNLSYVYPKNQQLFVDNLPYYADEKTLLELFKQYGTVIYLNVVRKPLVTYKHGEEPPTLYSYVVMDSPLTIEKVLKNRPFYYPGTKLRMNVKPKDFPIRESQHTAADLSNAALLDEEGH